MAIVRVVDQYNFPLLLRELSRAVRGGDTNIAAVVNRANTFAICISMLPPADCAAMIDLGRKKGMESLLARPKDPEYSEQLDVLLMGTFTQFLSVIDDVKELGPNMLRIGSEMKRAIFDYRERGFTVDTIQGSLQFGHDTLVMGILNVTPDSFSDGGTYDTTEKAVARALEIAAEGASILDIGGESTRPGSAPVASAEEQKRVVPVIEALLKQDFPLPISIDTRNAATAERCLAAGAAMVNDVSGFHHDPLMAETVAHAAVPVILTHSRGTPETMQGLAKYHDVMAEIIAELRQAMVRARNAGVEMANIILDPGIGFAKTADQSIETLKRFSELRTLGRPILVGPSRKSFLSRFCETDEDRMGVGTLAAIAACSYAGAHMVRVHDVASAVKVLRVVDGIRRLV
jgi:dihydropteroate synthase